MNTKTITMKITAAFAAALMLFSTAVSSVSAESTLIQIENANAFATSADIHIGENLTIDQRSHWAMIHTSQSMRAVYCLEPGKPVLGGDIYDADTENYLNSVTNPTLTAEEIRILLERVFQHGYTGNLDSLEGGPPVFPRDSSCPAVLWIQLDLKSLSFTWLSHSVAGLPMPFN